MNTNLLQENWRSFDQHELRIAIDEFIGGPGQFIDRKNNPNKFYLPLWGATCKIVLTFDGAEITAIEPGPAFEEKEWQTVVEKIEDAISNGQEKIGRNLSFSTFRVTGSWRGQRSGIQLLPPPKDAPIAPVEIAEHPFILEFPVKQSDLPRLTNYRWSSSHRRVTLILNLFLNGHTSCQLKRSKHRWALIEKEGGAYEAKWVSCAYFAKYGKAILNTLSSQIDPRLFEIEPSEYYALNGHDGKALRLPSGLDDALFKYSKLSKENRSKFDRAAFWMDLASRQWEASISSSFASLVSAIEALTERGEIHSVECLTCKTTRQHEVPGPTKKFIDFFENYAPGKSNKKRREEMYSVRSGILHGSKLLQLDQDSYFGWDPPGWDQRELTNELWGLTRMAVRQWLMTRA
jgi:hypothetical protein